MNETYFQKGFGLKSEVGPVLARTYQSAVVERLKGLGYEAGAGGLHFKLAREFGFCYGVDRAVDYAYQTRRQFPDRRVFLSGEIIHNPDVNRRIQDMGIRILDHDRDPVERFAEVAAGDVVILPAFGVSVPELEHLKSKQCVLVDTTCGSVLNVWKKVHYYARDGYTVIIHGKHHHEETHRDRVAGADARRRSVFVRARCGRDRAGLRLHSRHDQRRRADVAISAKPRAPGSIPTSTCSASAWPTRRRC